MHSMIELRGLHRFFGRTRAVCDVNFAVERGQVFGYIGPNGAGKTTSMRILSTLDQPTYGDALVDGFSVVNDPDRVRRRLGFMPDYFGTYSNVNVREYLDFYARAYGLRGSERTRALSYVMSFTKLDLLAEKPIDGLSKGMKQRLCLGRALIHDPAVLVLDEPAAGLDPRARIQLREMIRALAAHGKTVLVSSHILTELAEMCDLVGIIERGRLLAVGSVQEIQRSQQSRHATRVQVRLLDDAAALANWLGQREGVDEIQTEGSGATFHHLGDAEAEAALLRAMIEAGFRVVAFGSQTKTLEEVFMQVTEGHVQ
jgi:ABC-2 type transport system ATP-binding protein